LTQRADVADCRALLAWLVATAGARGADEGEVSEALAALSAALTELEHRQLRPSTVEQLERLQQLEPLLRQYEHEPEARLAIVQRKLGVKRSRAYELLAIRESDENRILT